MKDNERKKGNISKQGKINIRNSKGPRTEPCGAPAKVRGK